MEFSDAELVRKCLDGEDAAFEELVRRYQNMVLGVCYTVTRRPDAVADLAQDAFLRAYESLPKLREPEKFKNWLYGVARRTCIYWLRGLEAPTAPIEEVPDNFFVIPLARTADEISESEELQQLVMETLDGLPEDEREILVLRYLEDNSYKDMAEILGITISAVEARLRKARARLYFRIAKKIGDPTPPQP